MEHVARPLVSTAASDPAFNRLSGRSYRAGVRRLADTINGAVASPLSSDELVGNGVAPYESAQLRSLKAGLLVGEPEREEGKESGTQVADHRRRRCSSGGYM